MTNHKFLPVNDKDDKTAIDAGLTKKELKTLYNALIVDFLSDPGENQDKKQLLDKLKKILT